jgi:hypothetical protein
VPVAHACNPSYSGGRDDGAKPAWANSSWDPIFKKPITKKDCWSSSRCRPRVQALVPPRKKKSISISIDIDIDIDRYTILQYIVF